MTKKELASEVSELHDISKAEAERLITSVFDKIQEKLTAGEEVSVSGFGKFVVTDRPARKGINPSTKKVIDIPASKAIKFRSAKHLKDEIK